MFPCKASRLECCRNHVPSESASGRLSFRLSFPSVLGKKMPAVSPSVACVFLFFVFPSPSLSLPLRPSDRHDGVPSRRCPRLSSWARCPRPPAQRLPLSRHTPSPISSRPTSCPPVTAFPITRARPLLPRQRPLLRTLQAQPQQVPGGNGSGKKWVQKLFSPAPSLGAACPSFRPRPEGLTLSAGPTPCTRHTTALTRAWGTASLHGLPSRHGGRPGNGTQANNKQVTNAQGWGTVWGGTACLWGGWRKVVW